MIGKLKKGFYISDTNEIIWLIASVKDQHFDWIGCYCLCWHEKKLFWYPALWDNNGYCTQSNEHHIDVRKGYFKTKEEALATLRTEGS